jgi:broad specificity phosphatase PhoE
VDQRWVDTAARPFDPPLTPLGVLQGAALGQRLKSFSPPVTRIFTSPLGRTVQTAAAAAKQLGVSSLSVEPGLVEVLDGDWYACWRCRHDDDRGDANAATLFLTPGELQASVSELVDTAYEPHFDVHAMQVTRKSPETWAGLRERMASTILALAEKHKGETLLFVTHGGPIEAVLPALDPQLDVKHCRVNYTSLSVFMPTAGGYSCTVKACAKHIEDVVVEDV